MHEWLLAVISDKVYFEAQENCSLCTVIEESRHLPNDPRIDAGVENSKSSLGSTDVNTPHNQSVTYGVANSYCNNNGSL